MAESTAVIKKPAPFPVMLDKFKGEIARALPSHLSADRMARVAMTCFRKNPKLEECDPRSVFASVILASQLGLEPGILGQAFLVPYKGECQLIPGWQGFVDLVSRSGRASTWTGAVYKGDEFDYALGDRPFITHRPGEDVSQHPDNLRYVYAVGRVKGGDWPNIEVWTATKVEKHRDYYNKVGEKHYSFENFEMYARKIPLLQVIKYMPKSVELATAHDLEHSSNRGTQQIDLTSAIENTWVPPDAGTYDAETGEVVDQAAAANSRTAQLKEQLAKNSPPASAATNAQQQQRGTREPASPAEAEALAAIKAAKTPAELAELWAKIGKDWREVPLLLQGARDDRKAALEL